MNIIEFALLSTICTITPCRSKDASQPNNYTFIHHLPEFTKMIEYEHDNGRMIGVYEMRKNNTHCGYEFRFEGFPHKGVVLPADVPEIKYEWDSYQVRHGSLNIRALFTDAVRPEKPFEASFTLWGDRIYQVTVPVEERIHPHARE